MAANCWQHIRCSLPPHLPRSQPLGSKTRIVSSLPSLPWALSSLEPVSTWLSHLVWLLKTHTHALAKCQLSLVSLLLFHSYFFTNDLVLFVYDFSSTPSLLPSNVFLLVRESHDLFSRSHSPQYLSPHLLLWSSTLPDQSMTWTQVFTQHLEHECVTNLVSTKRRF